MIRILVSTSVLIFSLLTNFQSTHASPAILQLISDQKDLICDSFDSSKFKQTPLATWEVQEGEISIRLYDRQSPASISLDYKPTRAKWRLLTVTTNDSTGLPYSQMRISQDCEIRAIRRIRYDKLGRPFQIENLDPVSLAIKSTEPQNPRLELSEASGNAIKSSPALVALIDTGVNYLLPEFQKSIAFDSEGEIIGYDFWDNDTGPFDKDPRSNPFIHFTMVLPYSACWLGNYESRAFQFTDFQPTTYVNLRRFLKISSYTAHEWSQCQWARKMRMIGFALKKKQKK